MRRWRIQAAPAALFLIAFACCLPFAAGAQVQSVEVRIVNSSDDAEEAAAGAVSLNEAVLDLGGSNRRVGLRFPGVNIPRHAAIVKAHIEFTAAGADATATAFTIEGDYAENPAAFTTASASISSRDVYATSVNWSVDYAWQNVDQVHQSADLKAIVQKMVDRAGWNPGNAMAFIIRSTGNAEIFRKAKAADAGGNKGPKLYIEYTANILDIPIAADTDDMNQYWSTNFPGVVQNFTTSVAIGRSKIGNTAYAGLRFTGVNIPQGSTIDNAFIKFQAFSPATASTGATMKIFAEKRTATNTFSTIPGADDSVGVRATSPSVPRTSNVVTWSNPGDWEVNNTYATPDIKSVIQELVGQSGWDLGDKSMALFIGSDVGAALRKSYAFGSPGQPATLHVEFTPPGAGGGGPVIDLGGNTLVSQTCSQGLAAGSKTFALTNSGAATLNYTVAVTLNNGAGWLTLNPAGASGSLGPGAQRTFTINFNSTTLAPGLYEATIRFSDPAAGNSPQSVSVKLQVTSGNTVQCDSLPLYAQGDLFNPAVMLLLDLSGSMNETIATIDPGTTVASTPNIKSLVQKIVDLNAWSPGNAMAFYIERADMAQDPKRHAVSFDVHSAAAPLLRVKYQAGGGPPKEIAVRVSASSDDASWLTQGLFSINQELYLAQRGAGAGTGLRFAGVDIPKNATILEAFIDVTAYQSATGTVNLKIRAESSPNPAAFNQTNWLSRQKFSDEVAWSISAPWTGITIMKKIDIAKDVLKDLISDPSIAWGFGTWANTGSWAALNETPKTFTLVHVGCQPWSIEHRQRLESAIDAAVPQDQTPFGPSLDGAWRYFKGMKKDDNPGIAGVEDGSFFSPAPCQPKILINVTDGRGNIPAIGADAYLDLVKANTNTLCDAGVSVVGIGFGMGPGGDERAQLQTLAAVANQRGEADSADDLFAMHPKDANGNALAYLADTKDQLKAVFKQIVGNLQNAKFFGSAPAVSSISDFSERVLVSSFNAATREGDLTAVGKTPSGAWGSVLWKASEKLPDTRNLWTVKNGQLTAYTAATLPNDHWKSGALCKPIADIVHSTPAVVGPPPFYYNWANSKYKDFKLRYAAGDKKRDALAFVASNDGLLHAFRVADGVEKWAFLPPRLHAKLDSVTADPATDLCSDDYCYKYVLDGVPVVADIEGNFPSNPFGWGTILLIGQRAGGSAITALDITTGRPPGPAADAAKFLWDFTDPDLGETRSTPSVDRVAVKGSPSAAAWGVFFGSGVDEKDNLQPAKEAYLYGLNAATGGALWKTGTASDLKIKIGAGYKLTYTNYAGPLPQPGWKFGVDLGAACLHTVTSVDTAAKTINFDAASPPTCFGVNTYFNVFNSDINQWTANGRSVGPAVAVGLPNNALNAPLVVDFEGDHKADRLYVGDLYGTMYRVESIGRDEAPKVSRFFAFPAPPASPEETPIMGPASDGYEATNIHWVYWGTGRYETPADKTSRFQQYFFGLKDVKATGPTPAPYALGADMAVLQAEMKAATLASGGSAVVRLVSSANPAAKPWAIKLHVPATGASERVFTKPLVVGGIVFFTTFIPDTGACGGDGDTYVFAVDYQTGQTPAHPVFDLNGDGKFNDADKVTINGAKVVPAGIYVGRGQGSAPVLLKNTLFITTAVAQNAGAGQPGGLHALPVNLPQLKVRAESWKQE
jgi:hypothetical protein